MYNFFYVGKEQVGEEALDPRMFVRDLESDNLRLVHKVPGSQPHGLTSFPSVASIALTPAQFTFTKETAFQYNEYRVIKTNARGKKQKRLMGVDGTRIYNKQGGLNVRVPHRLISSVHSVEVLSDPMCFAIVFDDSGGGSFTGVLPTKEERREYRTETQVDCAEIVAKIQFLMKNPPKS